ncbi:TPR-repeat-containing protein [Parabacteroides distasonis ATCC 8503]|jgi:tetratricopeptide repeat protein|uniref:TPR-repeat-containing protein n=5 Tax=Parabacteroides distasonis TaxID=823 RepID=A6LGP9_PARD8|nr:TPR-repeat-containing protein [Parabacteroides distasonis ATCC 8503]
MVIKIDPKSRDFQPRYSRLFVLFLPSTNNTQMKKNIVFLLILIPIIWISCDGMGHQTIDFRKVENLMPQHPDSALMLLEQIENKENLSRKDKAHYSLLLTEAEDKTYVTHTTDSLISIAADYYEKTDDLGRKAKAWYYKGRINQDLGHPLKAQEYYLKALRDEEKIEDHALLGRIHNHIGMLYAYQKVYEKALPFQKKAVENFHLINDSTGQVFALRDLGRTFLMLGLQDSSIICNQKAIALMRKRIIPSVYTELAGLYIDRQRMEEAHGLLRTSLQNVAKPQAKYPVYLVLGELYKKSGQIDSARFYLQACINSAPLPETRAGGLFHLKEIALEKGQWEQAALLSKQYELLKDSIEQGKNAESIRNVQAFYSYNEIEQDLWEARLYASKQKSFYSLLITACLFLLTVALLRFIHYRRERKSLLQRLKANEEQIQRNEQTLKNISDVKDSLQNEIQIYKTTERQLSKEKDEQLKRTNEEIRQKIMQLEKLSHTKDELEKNLLTLRSENSNLKKREQAREEERKKIEESERLQNERLYDKFRSPAGWEPTDTDWHKLFISVDKLYPKMVTTLQKSTSLNESERKICYLSKIGVKPGAIEILLGKGNVSVYRKRLYEKLNKKAGTAKDFDKYISDI